MSECGEIIASGSLDRNILKCIAVSPEHQGHGVAAGIITELRKEAHSRGIGHLVLFTLPKNRRFFENYFFFPVAETPEVLFMENKPDGIEQYFSEAAHNPASGKIGSVVIGRAPFTCRQHLLIESASRRCDFLYVFVVSDKNDACSSGESLIAARTFASCIPNAGVYETGDYLIPCSSFPTYFIKDKSEVPAIKARLDSAVFAGRFAPILNISTLFMFSEPFPEVPAAYIRELAAGLRAGGIEIAEIPGGCHAAAFI